LKRGGQGKTAEKRVRPKKKKGLDVPGGRGKFPRGSTKKGNVGEREGTTGEKKAKGGWTCAKKEGEKNEKEKMTQGKVFMKKNGPGGNPPQRSAQGAAGGGAPGGTKKKKTIGRTAHPGPKFGPGTRGKPGKN